MNFKMRNCGMSLIKYILFGFNVVFAISGLGILIAGAVVLADIKEFEYFMEGKATAPPIVLIVTGLIIFLIASLGCFGAIRESPPLLLIYAALLAIIFIVELAVGIAACVFKNDLEMITKNSLDHSIRRSSRDDMAAWNTLQTKLSCCGAEDPYDWKEKSPNKTVPASCCVPKYIDTTTRDCIDARPINNEPKYYQEPCLGKLKSHVEKKAVILIGVGIGVAFIQILGIILACFLANTIRRERMK